MKNQPDFQTISEYILEKLQSIRTTNVPLEFIVQLNKLTKNPNVQISRLSKLIEREPSMSAQLLRISNSAYFSRGNRICSVSQAIMRLGLDTVKRIIVASGVFDLASDKSVFPFFNEYDYLKSSIAGATISEEIALRAKCPLQDDVYICALLRDFGVLILKQYFPELFVKIFAVIREKSWPFHRACASVCGMDHHAIASRLFAQWKLPIVISADFTDDETRKKDVVLMERICGHVDYILRKFEYAQWDPFSIPSENSINLFSADKEFNALMRKRIDEADDFMAQLTNAMQEETESDGAGDELSDGEERGEELSGGELRGDELKAID